MRVTPRRGDLGNGRGFTRPPPREDHGSTSAVAAKGSEPGRRPGRAVRLQRSSEATNYTAAREAPGGSGVSPTAIAGSATYDALAPRAGGGGTAISAISALASVDSRL